MKIQIKQLNECESIKEFADFAQYLAIAKITNCSLIRKLAKFHIIKEEEKVLRRIQRR